MNPVKGVVRVWRGEGDEEMNPLKELLMVCWEVKQVKE